MKKIIVPVLLLCLLLTACGQVSPQVILNNSQTTTISATSGSESTTTFGEPLLYKDNVFVAETVEAYNEFVAQNSTTLPQYLVPLDQFSDLGAFRCFLYWPESMKGNNNAVFLYSFTTEYGYILNLQYGHKSAGWTETCYIPTEQSIDLSLSYAGDLRKVSDQKGQFHIDKSGVHYRYIQGKLSWVTWTHADARYVLDVSFLAGGSSFADISADQQTAFVRDLLHTDTVEKAMQSFKATMEAAAVK